MERKAGAMPRRKYPAPQIRQTVASMIRLVRANPLILEMNTGTQDCTPEELRRKVPACIRNDPFGTQSKSMMKEFDKIDRNTLKYGRPSIPIMKTNTLPKKKEIVLTAHPKIGKDNGAKTDDFRKPRCPAVPKKNSAVNVKPSLKRKSYSTEDIPIAVLVPMNCTTQSMESLNAISPINNTKNRDKPPMKSTKIHISTPKPAKTPSLKELNTRLNNWLQKRKKLPRTFQHLQNIPEDPEITKMPKLIEEPEVKLDDKENAAGALNIEEETYKNGSKDVDNDILVQTLEDLKMLIKEGYDPEYCQHWLRKIQRKYANVEDMSSFWECRAALEQAGDNINEAIECYKRAIVHGAEIQGIDESLNKLFQKFGTLNLGDPMNNSPNVKTKLKNSNIICDHFKSSIIQFAIMQKKIKHTQMHKITSVVTPVRRSSRLSHIRTPNLRVSSTIEELTEDKEIKFNKNNHLSVRYN